MRPATLLRLALAGSRADTVRVALTTAAAALATLSVLATATVLAIQPRADLALREAAGVAPTKPGVAEIAPVPDGYAYQYTHNLLVEPGLRPGVAFALLMLCIPVLALAGQSAQLGAPARDRRLAQIRLAGASPRQAVAVAVTETGLAALLGAGLGTAVYFAGRALLHRPDADGRLPLPTDTLPPTWSLVVVGVGLPLAAALFAVLLLRRVAFTPFGLARRQRVRRPRPWPAILIVLGVAAFAAAQPVAEAYGRGGWPVPRWLLPTMFGVGGFVAMLGVVLGTASISYLAGRIMHRFARRPAALIAARQLQADPWRGSRVLAALLAATMVGAGAAGVRALFNAELGLRVDQARAEAAATGEEERVTFAEADNAFYFGSLDLVDLAVTVAIVIASLGLVVYLADGLVARRRAYSALVAAGVPRRTLARAVGWRTLVPVVPAIVLALAAGVGLTRVFPREYRSETYAIQTCTTDWSLCQEADSPYLRDVQIPEFVRRVEIPFVELAQVGGAAMAAVLVTVGIGLLFLRASTDVTELRAE